MVTVHSLMVVWMVGGYEATKHESVEFHQCKSLMQRNKGFKPVYTKTALIAKSPQNVAISVPKIAKLEFF